MAISLRTVRIPDFGIPLERPTIPAAIYEQRITALKARVGTDWIAVYADREHNANIAFLTGFEPRFEEALFLLGPGDLRILVVGNECLSYAPLAGLPGIETMLCQTMSLMGQDRSRRPNLLAVLRDAGISRGASIGLVGWKYLEPDEWSGPLPSFQASALVVDALRLAAGDPAAVADATPAMMHPEHGLRAVVDAHQIAAGEWGAARASAAVWRIVSGLRDGDSEYAAVARMGYAGEALNAHVMFASARAGEPVVGLRSPTARVVRAGDGVTTAVSYWGGLSSRAGLANDGDDAFLDVTKAYFRGLIAWYETADIGVTGGALFDSVTGALAEGGLESALNPGHLVGHDEWVHSPVRPGSTETIRSGMPFQIDVIPVPMPDGWALNCEDAVTFADEDVRNELASLYPDVWERIVARRAFMSEEIGVAPAASILPLSSTPLCLPPFWLAADRLLARD